MNDINKLFSVKDSNVVVIGGTGKIGLSIVNSLVLSGANVISVSRQNNLNNKFISNSRSGRLFQFNCDVSEKAGLTSLLAFMEGNNFSPDTLINALAYRPNAYSPSSSITEWDDAVLRNARSLFMLSKAFAELMTKNGQGSVINISSIYGIVAPDPELYLGTNMGTEPEYPFLKAGTIALTRYFASYYGKKGVRFNCIVPGGVFNNQEPNFLRKYIEKVPLARMADASDFCGAAIFLASEASSYVTGISIIVDGGLTVR